MGARVGDLKQGDLFLMETEKGDCLFEVVPDESNTRVPLDSTCCHCFFGWDVCNIWYIYNHLNVKPLTSTEVN